MICDNSLVTGFVEEKRVIDKRIVRDVAKDMEGPPVAVNGPPEDYVFVSVFIPLVLVGILFFWTREDFTSAICPRRSNQRGSDLPRTDPETVTGDQ